MWAEGFPAVTGFAIYTAAVYVTFRLLATRPRPFGGELARAVGREAMRPILWARARLGAVIAAGVALGTALVAFQLLSFTNPPSVVAIESRPQRPTLHLPLPTIATIVFPYAFGSPES